MKAQELKSIRLAHSMSQGAFAKEIGVGRTSLQRYEDGSAKIPKVVIRSIMLLDLLPPMKPAKT